MESTRERFVLRLALGYALANLDNMNDAYAVSEAMVEFDGVADGEIGHAELIQVALDHGIELEKSAAAVTVLSHWYPGLRVRLVRESYGMPPGEYFLIRVEDFGEPAAVVRHQIEDEIDYLVNSTLLRPVDPKDLETR